MSDECAVRMAQLISPNAITFMLPFDVSGFVVPFSYLVCIYHGGCAAVGASHAYIYAIPSSVTKSPPETDKRM